MLHTITVDKHQPQNDLQRFLCASDSSGDSLVMALGGQLVLQQQADKKSTVVKLQGVGDLFDLVYQDHFSFWVLDCVCIDAGKYKLLKFSRD